MRKIVVVAKSEFLTAIRSKGFIIGILLMPILMSIGIVVQAMSQKHVDVEARHFAVVGDAGMYDVLVATAEARNREIDGAKPGAQPMAKFFPLRATNLPEDPEEARLHLSDRIRDNTLFAFVEIPEDIASEGAGQARITYYSDKPTYDDLRRWIEQVVNGEILRRRLQATGLTEDVYRRLSAMVPSEHLGLAGRTASGAIKAADKVSPIRSYLVPVALMFVLFLVVMSATPQLLNGVLEEKMQRVSEMILGSVTPFELMLGKLVATTGVSAVLATLYLGGGCVMALRAGYGDAVTPGLLGAFALFMVLAVLFYGSVFLAIGAACSELKDAQGLMTPAMLILLLPMFVWQPVLEHPDSKLAVASSLFPPATPMLMMLRMATHPAPPAWQVLLGIALTTAATLACVWAAGRVFRIGILSQGKTPSIRELIRWVARS